MSGIHYKDGRCLALTYDHLDRQIKKVEHNKRGEVVSIKQFEYDDHGSITATHRIADVKLSHYELYDYDMPNPGDRQLKYTVSPSGAIKEYLYNPEGLLEKTLHYAKQADFNTKVTLDVVRQWLKITPNHAITHSHTHHQNGQPQSRKINHKKESFEHSMMGTLLSLETETSDGTIPEVTRTVDALDRVTCNTRADEYVKTIVHERLKRTHQSYNGLITVETLDKSGRCTALEYKDIEGNVIGQSLRHYYPSGNVRYVLEKDGRSAYSIYDRSGELLVNLNTNGKLSVYENNTDLGYRSTVGYQSAFDLYSYLSIPALETDWSALDKKISQFVEKHATDPLNTTTYDIIETEGRPGFTITKCSAETYQVKQNHYDKYGDDIGHTLYANTLDEKGLKLFLSNKNTLPEGFNSDKDIRESLIRSHGRVIGKIDPEGYVSLGEFDGLGLEVANHVYLTPLTDLQRAACLKTGLISDITDILEIEGVANTYTNYNAEGKIESQLDAEGGLTCYSYYENGLCQSKQIFSKKFESGTVEMFHAALGLADKSKCSDDQLIIYTYDKLHQCKKALYENDGYEIGYAYNKNGRKISEITHDLKAKNKTGDTYRAQYWDYDLFDRLISHINPMVSLKIEEMKQQGLTAQEEQQKIQILTDESKSKLIRNEEGLVLTSINSLGKPTDYIYNHTNHLIASISPSGILKLFNYNSNGKVRSEETAKGKVDKIKLLKKINRVTNLTHLRAALEPNEFDTITLTYYESGKLKSKIDADGYQTRYEYDAFNRLVREEKSITKEEKGKPEICLIHDYEYDRRGLKSKISQYKSDSPDHKLVTTHKYQSAFKGATSTQVGLDAEEVSRHDKLGRVTEVRSREYNLVTGEIEEFLLKKQAYDPFSRQIAEEIYNNNSKYQIEETVYNRSNRETQSIKLNGTTVSVNNIWGGTIQYVNQMGQLSRQSHSALGALTAYTKGTENKVVQVVNHDFEGNQIDRTAFESEKTSIHYDDEGDVESLEHSLVGDDVAKCDETFTHDVYHNQIEHTDRVQCRHAFTRTARAQFKRLRFIFQLALYKLKIPIMFKATNRRDPRR